MNKEYKFQEIANAYGFKEIEQEVDGIYCEACCVVHKRPTKLYHSKGLYITPCCKDGVISFYEDMFDFSDVIITN